MQIQIRNDCPITKSSHGSCYACQRTGYIYEWVDLADAIIDMLQSGQGADILAALEDADRAEYSTIINSVDGSKLRIRR